MEKRYKIAWRIRFGVLYLGAKRIPPREYFGSIEVVSIDDDITVDNEYANKAVTLCIEKYEKFVNIEKLSALVDIYKASNILEVEVMSVYRFYTDIEQVDRNTLGDKTKEKIQKLLNLSMSENENEAKVASQMAYKLMKKHSITREELDKQEIIMLEIKPKGKKVASWESILYDRLGIISGCYVIYTQGVERVTLPNIEAKMMAYGRERDVLNLSYLAECYMREIETLCKKVKVEKRYSTKEVNSYRFGLIEGICNRLKKDSDNFFTEEEKKHEIVVVNNTDRIDEAKRVMGAKTATNNNNITVGSGFSDGENDSKKIVINKATQGAKNETKRIG